MKLAILFGSLSLLSAGALAQAPACNTCHGANGEGNAQMNAPRIAGQGEGYLLRQLEAFANGTRNNPIMGPIAKQLTPAERLTWSKAYAAMETPPAKASGTAPALGRTLATVGDARRQIQACANCHGPDGVGSPPTVPYLAGQHQGYLLASLQQWKTGARKSDPSGQMSLL